MPHHHLKIVYMATADFALPALERLVNHGYDIRAVVTMPDKPAGRGMKLQQSSIKRFALERGIEVLQPVRLREEAFVSRLRDIAPDLGIVVAFRMLPEEVWSLPRLGTVNLHGSLLPRYRGAAPIHWAVINGERETGVSTFLLRHEIDTGDVLLQASTPIAREETTGEVYERLMHLGAELLEQTIQLFISGEPKPIAQEAMSHRPTHAPKLTKENTCIDWHRPAEQLYNFVRGLCPMPSAWAELLIPGQAEPLTLKVHASEPLMAEARHSGLAPGTVVLNGRHSLEVVCGEGVLRLIEIQPAGKKRMRATDFLNGFR